MEDIKQAQAFIGFLQQQLENNREVNKNTIESLRDHRVDLDQLRDRLRKIDVNIRYIEEHLRRIDKRMSGRFPIKNKSKKRSKKK